MYNGIYFIVMPIAKVFYFFVNRIPSIRKYYVTKDNDDPLDVALKRTKEITENPKLGIGTMVGATFSMSVLFFFYIGIYLIFKYLFFHTFEDSFGYVVSIAGVLAFSTDMIFTQINHQGEKYIKEFNKKKGWWRIKWKIITISSLFLSLWFSLEASSSGAIGRYLISLHS